MVPISAHDGVGGRLFDAGGFKAGPILRCRIGGRRRRAPPLGCLERFPSPLMSAASAARRRSMMCPSMPRVTAASSGRVVMALDCKVDDEFSCVHEYLAEAETHPAAPTKDTAKPPTATSLPRVEVRSRSALRAWLCRHGSASAWPVFALRWRETGHEPPSGARIAAAGLRCRRVARRAGARRDAGAGDRARGVGEGMMSDPVRAVEAVAAGVGKKDDEDRRRRTEEPPK